MKGSTKTERGVLITLSVMLLFVFAASIHMYDTVSNEMSDGALAVFARNARDFVFENEAVAVFLGVDAAEETDEYTGIDVSAEAAAYIERYNQIYENNK